MAEFCGDKGGGVLSVAEGQPFRLKLLGRLLEMAGDKDYEFSLWPRVAGH